MLTTADQCGQNTACTTRDRGRGSYIGAIHRITVVHTIYTIVYGLRFSVQISPGLARYRSVSASASRVRTVAGSSLVLRRRRVEK